MWSYQESFPKNGCTPKLVSAEPKNTGESFPVSYLFHIKFLACTVEQFNILHESFTTLCADKTVKRTVGKTCLYRVRLTASAVRLKADYTTCSAVVNALEFPARSDRPVYGRFLCQAHLLSVQEDRRDYAILCPFYL